MTLFGAAFVGIFWLGAILLSPIVKSWLHRQSDFNATLGNYLGYFGVIYGLLLGLLEIGTYENFTNAEKAVANEAAALLALYRNTASYPEPYRSDFRTLIRDYARTTIDDAWPKQRRGIIPVPGNANPVVAIYHRIAEFEPQTMGQQSVHEATLAVRHVPANKARAPLQRCLGHAKRDVVRGRARRDLQFCLPVAVRLKARPPFAAGRHDLVFHRDHDLPDRAPG